MLELLLLVVLALLIGFAVFAAILFFRYRKLLEIPQMLGVLSEIQEFNISEYSQEGGIARVASRQSKSMLSDIMASVFDNSVPMAGLIREFVPQVDEWIKEKPYGVASLLMNPMFQKLVGRFNAAATQQAQPQPTPQNTPQW